MHNSKWTRLVDEPLPKGETVLCYLAEEHHGSRFAIHSSRKIMNGYMGVINGLFDFDFGIEILAWRRMNDLADDMPIME
jgi:hypothetical protein